MDKLIVDTLEELKPYSEPRIYKMQQAHIPSLDSVDLEVRYEYYYVGSIGYPSINEIILYAPNIQFQINYKRSPAKMPLKTAIEKRILKPVLLFQNGYLVDLDNIELIIDMNYTYLYIKNLTNKIFQFNIITFPFDITLNKAATKYDDDDNTLFAFTSDGAYANELYEGTQYTMIKLNNNCNLYHQSGLYKSSYRSLKLSSIDNRFKLNICNFICFNKYGKIVPSAYVDIDEFNAFSIYEDNTDFVVFYDRNMNKSINNALLYNIDGNVFDSLNITYPQISLLKNSFKVEYDINKKYEENVDAFKDQVKYNPDIFYKLNQQSGPIKTMSMTGKEFKDISKTEDNKVYFPRGFDENHYRDHYLMIFVNGCLLKNYFEIVIKYNFFVIPTNFINDDDTIEVMYFTDIDNRTYTTKISESGRMISDFSEDINVNNIKFFSKETPKDLVYNIGGKDRVFFPVDCKVENGRVSLTDPFYYNKDLYMASNRQFRHCFYKITKYGIRAKLTEDFNFADTKQRYIVFINGRKVNDFHFTEISTTRPFTDRAIYTHTPMERDDIIDIFYLPYEPEVINSTMDYVGNLSSNYEESFIKETSMLFINGKKIPTDDFAHVPLDSLRLLKEYKSVNNVQLYKLVDPIIAGHNNTWDAVNKLNVDEKNKLINLPQFGGIVYDEDINKITAGKNNNTYNINSDISADVIELAIHYIDDTEENISMREIAVTKVLYEIIKDYWTKPDVNNGSIFIYDYDDQIININDTDVDNTYIIRLLDALRRDKMIQVNVVT